MKQINVSDVLADTSLVSLTQCSVFGALPESAILWLLEQGEIFELQKDERLFSQGERGDDFFVILQGQLRYYKHHLDQNAFIRNFVKGEQIGFLSMIALHDRVGEAIAAEETILLKISSQLFHEFHQHSPMEFGILLMNLSRELARSLRKVNNLVVDLTSKADRR